jgi:hypothetical protein
MDFAPPIFHEVVPIGGTSGPPDEGKRRQNRNVMEESNCAAKSSADANSSCNRHFWVSPDVLRAVRKRKVCRPASRFSVDGRAVYEFCVDTDFPVFPRNAHYK